MKITRKGKTVTIQLEEDTFPNGITLAASHVVIAGEERVHKIGLPGKKKLWLRSQRKGQHE